MIWLYSLIFLISFIPLYFSGKWVVGSLTRIAKYLNWREFVVSFFIMAFAGAIPNLFVGVLSAIHKIPQLSFGDIVGGNVIDLTIAVALATLVAKEIPAKSRTVQTTSLFTISVAILPLLLILDGVLSRGDGILLIGSFFFYIVWLFSRRERFTRIYDKTESGAIRNFKVFIKDLGKVILGIIFLIIAAEGIVKSSIFLAEALKMPIALIGILIVGLGNALPETYFAITSARAGETWMILGDLMGSVITPSTLILGTVSLICPIKIFDFSSFAVGRIFLIISALFFFFFVRSDRKITKREAIFLFLIYILFIISEIFLT